VPHLPLWRVLINKHVLVAALVYAGSSAASNGLSLWQPQLIKSFGLTNMETGLLNSIPFAVASVGMVLWGRRSDRSGERVWHTALPLGLVAVSLACANLTAALAPTILILCLAIIGTYAIKGPFWALSTEWLSAGTAAAGIAQINAIGNLGGFAGNYLIGAIKEATGSYAMALLPLVALSAVACVAVLLIGRGHRAVPAPVIAE
jgi:ACS family tartrate transporter-like MFS transporter